MQLPILFYLTVMWILLSQAKDTGDPKWKINVNQNITATKGSNIIIFCTFETPPEQKTNITVYWKTNGRSSCSRNDNDKLAFAFHPSSSCIDPHFQGRTKLIGEASDGNCSLQIFNIRKTEPSIYVRVSGRSNYYSFKKHAVKFYVDEKNLTSAMPDVHDDGNIKMYLAIFVPLPIILIIAAAGIVAYKTYKRSHTFKRQESGYYANFRQASSTTAKSESICETSNQINPDPNVYEPIYLNIQISANQMDQQVEL
ncbi:uncharacterized protein LOC129371419 isoform X2 [Poeciliopsis prolifica]|uniref:uncharacterized protein LOC129371419 isoform X2 n=1 Tax=Poeciliopsis prolifica TaxID=188132 RepID=UPI002413B0C2|nr:uncharacterized protein LOC129371419 isoform X2 [Poeciliopsis prolifica]